MAEDRNPETVAVGVDFEITAAEILFFVNGVPVFAPGEPFGGPEQMESQLRMNPSFRKGRNVVTLMVRMIPDGALGYAPIVRMDFGHWEFLSQALPFDGRPMAVSLQVAPQVNAAEQTVQEITASVAGQPLMAASMPLRSAGDGALEAWNTYTFELDIDVDLPPMAWLDQGQMLEDTPALREGLTAEMRRVHDALAQSGAAARQTLDGFISRQAAALGATADEYFEYTVQPVLDAPPEQRVLKPFDISAAELAFFGGGRLATFVPIPHRFDDLETGGAFTLYFYYWKDAKGDWQLIH